MPSRLIGAFPDLADLTAARDFDLPAGDERTAHGGAEEVFAAVDGAGAERGPDEIFDEFLSEIFDVALVSAGGDGFGTNAFELVALSDVAGNANDFRSAVVLLEPRHDDGCIQSARISERNRPGHFGLK